MIIAIVLFIFLLLPYQGLIPTLDGRHDLVNALNLATNNSVHPPVKSTLIIIFTTLFGNYSYTWIGFLLGIIGIVGIYQLTKLLADKRSAIIASFLLSLSGLYVSTSLFSMTDFMISILVIYAFYFYYTQKINWYIIICALGVLTKETFLLVPLSILLVSIFQKRLRWQYFHPFIVFFIWLGMIKLFYLSPWNQQNFSEFSKYGSFETIFMNVITLKIFNQYAFGAWQQMFVLNFNWFFWLIAVIQLGYLKWNKSTLKYYFPMIIFVFLYTFLVLSFPTWSIPRYFLPIWPFLLILLATHIWKNKVLLALVFLISFVSLFYSVDPVSHGLYKEREILQQKFYDVPFAGIDGITYNMQYLYFTRRVNWELQKDTVKDCYYIFLGMKDDKELRSIYHFPLKPCP